MTNYLNAKNGIEIWHADGITQILAGTSDPSVLGVGADVGAIYIHTTSSGNIYKKYGSLDTEWRNIYTTVGGGASVATFLELSDTPSTYNNSVGKYVRVNSAGDSLEFNYINIDTSDQNQPLIPETAISGTYFVNFEGGRLLIGATGAKPDLVYMGPIGGLAFADNADEACYGSFKIPYAWHTETDIRMKLNFMVDDTQIGEKTCSWRIDFQAYSEGESYNDKSTTTVSIDTVLTTNTLAGTFYTKDIRLVPNDVNNPLSRGDMVVFKLYRKGNSTTDTVTGDVVLIALMVEMTTGQHILGGV